MPSNKHTSSNRREVLRISGATLVSMTGLTGVASAKSSDDNDEQESEQYSSKEVEYEIIAKDIEEEEKENEKGEKITIYTVTVEKKEKEKETNDVITKVKEVKINNESGEISYLGEPNTISPQGIEDSVEAINRVHKDIDEVGDCDELHGHDNHNKAKLSVDFKQSVNNLGWTTVAAILASWATSTGITAAIMISGAALALVSEEDDISLVFEEVDFGDTPYTYCYVTGGWKEYDTDEMTLYSKEEGMHAVPPSF
ncbi:hypothetical protein [Haloarcula rubripromontorii]|uniref:hypothetical protein n=1 Tax=Haloarcula rubripromontorii TaxID=1705562 RepID=UPI0012BB1485|nr:hypothetical protein [Haloarcula rubripromontorii]